MLMGTTVRPFAVRGVAIIALVALGLSVLAPAASGAARTTRASVRSNGGEANGLSGGAALSATGRFVAFDSIAANLVPGDTNGEFDVFVRDRKLDRTNRVSVRSSGGQGNGGSFQPAISAGGRFVAFPSSATNLVQGDTNDADDVFVHDRTTGKTRRLSLRSNGTQTNDASSQPALSASGRFVAFVSLATNLVPGDANGVEDIFVHDRRTGTTRRVSVGAAGQADGPSTGPSISAGGRFVAFSSDATNLVANDTNGVADVFVHDRRTGKTRRVSVGAAGQADGSSAGAAISGDGRFVAFASLASDLVADDTNDERDIFVRDRKARTTRRVSVGAAGQADDRSQSVIEISGDGRYVAFPSDATNLVSNDTNGLRDIFVRDRKARTTRRVNVGAAGQADGQSENATISRDGRFAAFYSHATNLVSADTNGVNDVFVRGPLR
ncbi:PD40 domain-containing protein [soil metagenome]